MAPTATDAAGPRPLLPAAPAAPWPLAALGLLVDWTVVAIGATMVTIVFVNVIFHLFGRDNAWTIELSELLMVWVTFLGGACAARRNAHMAITELLDKLGPPGRRVADFATQLVVAVVLLLLVRYGWVIVDASWGNQLTVLGIPMAIQYLALPVGSAIMLAFVLFDLVRIARGVPRGVRYATAGEEGA